MSNMISILTCIVW